MSRPLVFPENPEARRWALEEYRLTRELFKMSPEIAATHAVNMTARNLADAVLANPRNALAFWLPRYKAVTDLRAQIRSRANRPGFWSGSSRQAQAAGLKGVS